MVELVSDWDSTPTVVPYLEMNSRLVANVAEQVRRMPMAVDRAPDVDSPAEEPRCSTEMAMFTISSQRNVMSDLQPTRSWDLALLALGLRKGSLDGFSVL